MKKITNKKYFPIASVNTIQEAIRHMENSVSIQDWNNKREELMDCGASKFIQEIDCSGLIVRVLGPDKIAPTFHTNRPMTMMKH